MKGSAVGLSREGARGTSMSRGVAAQTELKLLTVGFGLISLTTCPVKLLFSPSSLVIALIGYSLVGCSYSHRSIRG